jgi:protocatechuate 3,4-dioxygenase beta subunit
MEVITAYNFVVDSNVESPSTNGPSAAHLGVKIYNDGTTPLTNVRVCIGDLLNPVDGSGTPGVFPSRTVNISGSGGYSGTFALQMPGGVADAVRTIPRIEPGEYSAQYFFVTYPLKDPSGNSVAGAASVVEDDLWLNYDFWASASDGAATRRVDRTTKVTMRNEISAMANKIWPNTDSKVPAEYVQAVEQSIGWRPSDDTPQAGAAAQLEGVWYDLGNVGAGFDNDGDGLPDRNIWMQPVGDPGLYDPLAVRLIGCHGLVIIKLNDGTNQIIPFKDRLYFDNIPENNNGAVGLVFYDFLPLKVGGRAQMTPYQEVASGYDNEKFNSDYGAPVGGFTVGSPDLTFDKAGPAFVTGGTAATYSLSSTNTGSVGIGFPELSLPLVFEDEIPADLSYVAGSALSNNTIPSGNTVAVSWSTDHGVTWLDAEPSAASVTTIRWTLGSALAAGATATVRFQAEIPVNYPTVTVDNTGIVKLGPTGELGRDSVTSFVSGINSIGDLVWKDDNRNSVKDIAESGIPNIKVDLYYDANGNASYDTTDIFLSSTQTDSNGAYSFLNLPDGKFIVIVDSADADLPSGYSLATTVSQIRAASLDPTRVNSSAVSDSTIDWPFIGALEVVKSVNPTTYGAGSLVTYTIDLENHSSSVASNLPTVQTAWASTVTGNRSAQFASNAQGYPDSAYGRIDWAASADNLAASGQTFTSASGTITKVEILFNGYVTSALTNDTVEVNVNGSLFTTLGTSQLNTLVGLASNYAIDVTSLNPSWTWTQVQALTSNFVAKKVSSADGPILWMDSIGVRVTTSAPPPVLGAYGPFTIDPLPLVDSYDAAKLQYVSASVPPSSVAAGTISWNNLGPLNPGVRKSLTVTFRALTPPDTNGNGEPDSTTHVNVASSSGAKFVSGRSTNSASSSATITIQPRGEIGDTVFWDINANGVQDSGEPGLANVLVSLSNGAQALTDSSGKYRFTGLVNDTYTVTVSTSTLPWTSFTQTKDPDATVNNASTVTINLNDGSPTNDSFMDRDFGYDSTLNVISGTVFTDNNGDGDQDAGEGALSGTTVTLLRDTDSNGTYETTVTTTTTNSSGYYQFTSLNNGLYRVVVTQPSGTVQTLDPDLSPGATGGDNATNENASGGNLYPNNNFAYKPTGGLAIGDTLYVDWNGDGDQDAGEEGIANLDVWLYEDANGNGSVDPADDALVASAVTDSNGVYGFSNLPAGNWLVLVNTSDPQFPSNVVQIQDYDGTRDSKAVINLTASNLNVDFGYKPQGYGSIGDAVFVDLDGNGVHGAGESGIPGVGLSLYEDGNANGVLDADDALVATATSGSNGAYLFIGLAAGRYLVDVDGSSVAIPTDAYGNIYLQTTADPHLIVLASAQTDLTADFGFVAPATIGDFVFYDANANGTQDWNESGIDGVTVQLFADANADGQPDGASPLASTVTEDGSGVNPAGFYQFSNLPAGTYFVKVLASTLPQAGGQPIPLTADPDRDGVPVADNSYPGLPAGDHGDSLVVVTLGANYTGADFGYQPPGAIGDFVWLDSDQDGVQDSGEPGIAGVTVVVTNGTLTYNVVTDFDGYWSVANLPDGNWSASVASSNFDSGAPLQYMSPTYDADGVANSSVSFALTSGQVGLAAGNLGLDFGYALVGSYGLSGTVIIHDTGIIGTADDIDDFVDDGVDQDAGAGDETELGGVTVYLYTTGGDFLGSTTTDSNGNYAFAGLPPGAYRVAIGTTAAPLDRATLTTTAANNAAVSSVTSSATSVIQTLSITSSSVADVDFAFLSTVNHDYGDLPSDYGMTTLAQGGARHVIPAGGSTIWLGSAPDADTNGPTSARADGDDLLGSDDEDGIAPVNPSLWSDGTVGAGHGGSVTAAVHGSGWLCGWIDWNQDGDFVDAGEFVMNQAVSTGNPTIAFDIPAGTVVAGSQSWLSRFRLFATVPSFPLFSFSGEVVDGEVEDYLLEKPVGGSIGDLVWLDADGDGAVDASESGIAGLQVELRNGSNLLISSQNTSDGSQDVDGDGITDPVGYYRFRGLAAGVYQVVVTNPPSGHAPSYDEDGAGTASISTWTLVADDQHLTADFGYEPLRASIAGQVRYDGDADGDLNEPDPGAAFVKVQLWTDPDQDGDPGDGVQVGETYTDSSGNYLFSSIPTGNYVVVEVNPLGSASTADVDGGNMDRIAVAMSGINITGRDFLDTTPPVHGISGTVYKDGPSNDNVVGSGDVSIPSVTVRLYFDRDGNGAVSAGDPLLDTAVTNAAGFYQFSGLVSGSYLVEETDPAGAVSDWDAQGGATDNQIAVVLASSDITERDFLDDGPIFGSISGSVLADLNGDGTSHGPLAGVELQLLDSSGLPVLGISGLPKTTSTSAGGTYSFENLLPGSYRVVEVQPANYASVSDVDGPNDNIIGNVTPIPVVGGANSGGNNFIEIELCTISGYVYADSTPMGGVTLTLLDQYGNPVDGDPDTPDIQLITTVTDGSGFYQFSGVRPGTYQVGQTQPYGYDSFGDVDGGDINIIGDVTPITLLPGQSSLNNNFVETLDTCPDDWTHWKFLHPLETPTGNPDQDAYDNFAEFAFAMPHDDGTGSQWLDHTAWIIRPSTLAPGTLEGVFIRHKGAPTNVVYTLQYAANAGNPTVWQSLVITPAMISTVDNGDCTETVTIHDLETLTGLAGGKGVVRVQADLDDDGGNDEVDHTSHTEPEGWTETSLELCCRTYNNPYLRESVFTGTVSGVSGQTLTFAVSGGSADLADLVTPGQFYLEVTSGENEGHRFDIASATGHTVTLGSDAVLDSVAPPYHTKLGAPPSDLTGDTIAIHRHWTLDELFPPGSFGATGSQSTADQVQVFANGAWTIFWLYDENDGNPATARWVDAADGGMANQGTHIIPPGQGMFFNNRAAVTSILSYGEVRTNDFIRPLGAGNNLVGGGFPVDQSANSTLGRSMNPTAGFFGSMDFKTADSFFIWRADTQIGLTGYDTYYLLSGAPIQPSLLRWVKVGDASAAVRDAETLLLRNRSAFVRSKNGVSAYKVPSPWNP